MQSLFLLAQWNSSTTTENISYFGAAANYENALFYIVTVKYSDISHAARKINTFPFTIRLNK